MDLLIDKQELIRIKLLEASDLGSSDTVDVSVRRQLEGKIVGLCKKKSAPSQPTRTCLLFPLTHITPRIHKLHQHQIFFLRTRLLIS